MNVAVIYCCPTVEPVTYLANAKRFVRTWREHPPGYPHQLHVMVNGNSFPEVFQLEFNQIQHDWQICPNTGWDIGAYQRAAETIPADLMVFLGAHVSFNHDNWLAAMVNAFIDHGPGLYGAWGVLYPTQHIRTTAFWCPPQIVSSYPLYISSERASRYQFEHGQQSITSWCKDIGFPVYMVTVHGVFEPKDWEIAAPTSEESILLDRHHTGT